MNTTPMIPGMEIADSLGMLIAEKDSEHHLSNTKKVHSSQKSHGVFESAKLQGEQAASPDSTVQ